ncbi:hypothetical protein Q9L58_005813 [Maublancomyces gigas]|uniref:Uncharacterized protein n=1 Tax=Discina gigas TaxID=1032678 RepID=A0ABR3GHK5_9PEZI
MASSSHNRQNTAVRGGMGLTKTPANTASDPGSSFLYGTNAGLHDTHDQNAPKVPKGEMNTSGGVGDGTQVGRTVKEGIKGLFGKLGGETDSSQK